MSATPSTINAYQLTPGLSSGYKPKVSFDTFENPAASMFSFTLQVHTEGFCRTKDTRTYLCAASADPSGRQALAWAIENLVQDSDELIVFRGFDADVLERDHDIIRSEARDFMQHIQERLVSVDPDRKVSITIEFIAGKITQTIDRLIALYRPDSLVVGTRGPRGMMQTVSARFGATAVGGVSKYCLSHSPVPVIVVRPEAKVRKALDKRRADPKRGTHFDDGSLRRSQSRVTPVPITPSISPTSGR
ncbi:hypothetical protein K488DRAFT_86484 [Vararia minispora EC-137]|uniref:Uncharacterized protein n=1 Tax=Vararia minispora EC-137 TaxID=1314806 RepID=A0ACB8QJJ4_9AGAM|nr:hypothetical protein K488DRAFT_86484 [Vararia minispora EC-137]